MPETFVGYHAVPYYPQTGEFLAGEASLNQDQITTLGDNLCGLLCALMVLNAFSEPEHTVSELLTLTEEMNAYDAKRGWIHDKLVRMLTEYGIEGKCQSASGLDSIYELLKAGNLIIASVSPHYLDSVSRLNFLKKKSGHLVLVNGMLSPETEEKYKLVIHDPGSKFSVGGQNIKVDGEIFKNNFSGRIIVFKDPRSAVYEKI